MSQITVISGPERRRVWTDQQKREVVAAVSAPGANVAEIVPIIVGEATVSALGKLILRVCRSGSAAQSVFPCCQFFKPTQRHSLRKLTVELNMKPDGSKRHNMMENRRLHQTWSALRRQYKFGTHSAWIGYAIAQSAFRHLYQPPYPWLRTMILTKARWNRNLCKHVSLTIWLQAFGKFGSGL